MIPASVESLVILLWLFTPGFVYSQLTGRSTPRGRRSDAAFVLEVLVCGAGFSLLGFLSVTAALMYRPPMLTELAAALRNDDVTALLLTQPRLVAQIGIVVVATTVVGHAYAVAVAAVVNRVRRRDIRPDENAWSTVFNSRSQNMVMVTVRLRDGHQFEGLLRAFTTGAGHSPEQRELVLSRPLYVQQGNDHRTRVHLPFEQLILHSGNIDRIGVLEPRRPTTLPGADEGDEPAPGVTKLAGL